MTPSEGGAGAAGEGALAAAMGANAAATQPDAPSGGLAGGAAQASGGAGQASGGGSAAPTVVAAPAAASASPAASGKKRTLAQRALDRVPLKWLTTGFTVVFLGATAAFGGLAEVPAPELPVLEQGQTFIGAELEMTPVRVIVADELRGTGVFPAPGERVLSVVMDVRNLSDHARASTADGSLKEVRVDGLQDITPSIARLDDDTFGPWLQPNVPVRVVLSWAVPASMIGDGEDVRVRLHTSTRGVGRFVIYGVTWSDTAVAAYMDLPAEDLDHDGADG